MNRKATGLTGLESDMYVPGDGPAGGSDEHGDVLRFL
jgi:hypothetical protein